jgi:hypothetical protein
VKLTEVFLLFFSFITKTSCNQVINNTVCSSSYISLIMTIVGGTRRDENAPSEGHIYQMSFTYDSDDVTLIDVKLMTTTGATLPPLHGPQAFIEGDIVYVHGGQRLMYNLGMSDKLYQLRQDKNKINVQIQKQNGDIPDSRSGHTITYIGDRKYLLHGGCRMDLATSPHLVRNRFRQVINDRKFYVLDINSFQWSVVQSAEATKARCNHTCLKIDFKLFFIGGLTSTTMSIADERIKLTDVMCLNYHNLDDASIMIYKFSQSPSSSSVFLSNHSSILFNGKILIFGGIHQTQGKIGEKIDVNGTDILFEMDTESKIIENGIKASYNLSDFRTRGHTMHVVDDDCVMVIGGTMRSIVMYTTKLMTPSPCDLNERCTIADSDIISPIPWVQCEFKCKRWLHWFCVKITRNPKGKYKCQDCKR